MSTTNDRIHVVDALRGFSLAGIVLVHMVENYIGGPPPAEGMEAANQGILDAIVNGFVFIFIRGKFFALFSFLFGLSFFIQMDKATQKGQAFAGRFLWRLVLLFAIGYLHHLFYRGDILTVYAMLGILLIPFYKINIKWLSIVTILIFLGTFRYLVFGTFGSESLFSDMDMNPQSPSVVNYFNLIKNGSLLEVFQSNATEGHLMKLDFQLGTFSRGYLTFGFFLLGLIAGKTKFFLHIAEHRKKMIKGLIWCAILFVVTFVLMSFMFIQASGGGQAMTFDNWLYMIALTCMDLWNIVTTLLLIFAFLLIYLKVKGEKLLLKFAPYGKMALTNYVAQSVVGTFILYGWGMGYLGELRNIYTFLIGLLIVALQMGWSTWWLRRFKYGPLEWLWRSLTYFKMFPMKAS